jgi:alkyl sulfatase BDS1-like metallo-beta-lactamase superfamily hydrolase
MDFTISENVYAGDAMNRRLFYQYGLLLPASRMTQTPPQGQNYTRARERRERMGGVSTFGATSL